MKPLPLLAILLSAFTVCAFSPAEERPNVLWFVVDDMSANFSCYGEKLIQTPAVDKLAEVRERLPTA